MICLVFYVHNYIYIHDELFTVIMHCIVRR